MERGQGGSIVNLGSMSGLVPLSRVFTYSMMKAAVHNLTKNLAREWAPHKVRVNAIVPGFFPAEQNRQVLTPDRVAAIMGHTPMKRFGESRELGGALCDNLLFEFFDLGLGRCEFLDFFSEHSALINGTISDDGKLYIAFFPTIHQIVMAW